MFEMIVAWMMGNGFFAPLRMIGAIALGEEALEPSYSLLTAAAAGLVVHMMLSIIFGAIAGAIISAVTALQTNALALIVATSIFGFLLWIVNFFVIAPAAFEWFTMADDTVQFFAHTFFYGTVLGLLLVGWLRSRESMTD
jgi:cytochrome b561